MTPISTAAPNECTSPPDEGSASLLLLQAMAGFHRTSIAERIAQTRPKKMTEKLADPIGVRLPHTQRIKFERIAAAQGLNTVDVMRALVDKYVEEYEEKYRALKSIFDDLGS